MALSEKLDPHAAEPAVVGYIWGLPSCCAPCLVFCESWLPSAWRPAPRTQGLTRAQEMRKRRVQERCSLLEQQWACDAQAVELEIASLNGHTWRVQIGQYATAGEIKCRLGPLVAVPEMQMVLICGGKVLGEHESLPPGSIQGPGPHLQLLRVWQSRALSASLDGTLRLWDTRAQSSGDDGCLAVLRGHGDAITSLDVDWASRRALTGSHDCRLKIWDLDHCICVATFSCPGHPAFCLATDWSSGRALSGSWDRAVKVWDLHAGVVVSTLEGHGGSIKCLCLAWDLERALSGGDGALVLWNLATSTDLWTANGHEFELTSCAADWAAQRACSGDEGGEIRVWDLEAMVCINTLSGHRECISGISLDWGRGLVYSTSWDGTLRCWDTVSGHCTVGQQEGTTALTCMAVDWQASSVLCGCSKGFTLWDARRMEVVMMFHGHQDAVSCVSLELQEPTESVDFTAIPEDRTFLADGAEPAQHVGKVKLADTGLATS